LQALALGAAGCCNSRSAPAVLRQVAVVVSNGGLWVGQSLLRQLVGATSRRLGQLPGGAENDDWSGFLSEREVQVARLIANGASNKEIADRLVITERTVKAHLTAIFEKLGVRDRLQLSLRVNGVRI
jgi:DNA-binding NarL/FixJ family response regulator